MIYGGEGNDTWIIKSDYGEHLAGSLGTNYEEVFFGEGGDDIIRGTHDVDCD